MINFYLLQSQFFLKSKIKRDDIYIYILRSNKTISIQALIQLYFIALRILCAIIIANKYSVHRFVKKKKKKKKIPLHSSISKRPWTSYGRLGHSGHCKAGLIRSAYKLRYFCRVPRSSSFVRRLTGQREKLKRERKRDNDKKRKIMEKTQKEISNETGLKNN